MCKVVNGVGLSQLAETHIQSTRSANMVANGMAWEELLPHTNRFTMNKTVPTEP